MHLFLQLLIMNVITIPFWIICNALVTLVGWSWWGFISSKLLQRFYLLGIMNFKLFHNFSIILLLLYLEFQQFFLSSNEDWTLHMTPFFFFLGVVCYIQCMWWTPRDFNVDKDISFPRIDLSPHARACVWHWGVVNGGRDGIYVTPKSWCNSNLTGCKPNIRISCG